MNVVWMAALAIYMTAEKIGSGRWLTQIGGLALIATGIGLFIINMITG
jgi:predicted metal-binding membrane protein